MLGGLGDAPSGRVQPQPLNLTRFLSEPNHLSHRGYLFKIIIIKTQKPLCGLGVEEDKNSWLLSNIRSNAYANTCPWG